MIQIVPIDVSAEFVDDVAWANRRVAFVEFNMDREKYLQCLKRIREEVIREFRGCSMKDEDRVHEELEAIGEDKPHIEQAMNRVARGIRADENRRGEADAIANESRKTAEAIRARRES